MGRNGVGKSTLLKILVGLLRPQEGTVALRRTPDDVLDPHRTPLDQVTRLAALVPQNPSRLLFHDRVDEELAFTLRTHGTSEEFLVQLQESLGIGSLGSAHPRDLSTGERQRVALAAVLAAGSRILLLDEPTRGLDPATKGRLGSWLRGFTKDGGTVVMATHDVELVAATADEVAWLDHGKLVKQGSVAEVLGPDPIFGPQISRLLGDGRWQTPHQVLQALAEVP